MRLDHVAARNRVRPAHVPDGPTHADELVRLAGSVQITPQLALTARVENLFDEKYQLISGYNPQPRTVLAGLVLRLP